MRLAPAALVLAIGACSFSGKGKFDDATTGDGTAQAWLDGYARRKPIRIAGTAGLADVPIGIVVRADPELAAHARADGGDLVVAAADGTTVLAAELVAFDGTSGALELWVRVPVLAPNTDAYLYYDGPQVTHPSAAVWSARYAGVWHLAGSGDAVDSTAANDGLAAPSPSTSPASAIGPTAAARDYDGVDDTLRCDDASSESLDFPTGSFAYSIWTRVTSGAGEYDAPIWNGGTSIPEPGYTMLLGHNDWGSKIHDGTTYVDASFGSEATLGGRWVYLTTVVDRQANRLRSYTDGVLVTEADIGGIGSLQNTLGFSLGVASGVPFRGALDEVRVYTDVISADLIAVEHANLADPAFVTLGDEAMRRGAR